MIMKDKVIEIVIETGKDILNSSQKKVSGKMRGHKTHVMPEQSILSGKKMISSLKKLFPNYNYSTQEFGVENNSSDYTWIVNALAGKNNYLDGRDTFTTEIALQKNDKTIFSIIYLPKKEELFLAEEGKGATLNGKLISISEENNLEKAVVTYSTYPGKEDKTKLMDDEVLSKIPNVKYFGFKQDKDVDSDFGRGSMGAEFCYLACGRIDGVMRFQQKLWNVAAGELIAREANATFATLPEGDYVGGNQKLVSKMKSLIR